MPLSTILQLLVLQLVLLMEETVVPKENLYLITILNIIYIVSRTHDQSLKMNMLSITPQMQFPLQRSL